jgi:hypothetical protein
MTLAHRHKGMKIAANFAYCVGEGLLAIYKLTGQLCKDRYCTYLFASGRNEECYTQ